MDTFSAGATGDLANIIQTNFPDGSLLLIRPVSSARLVVVKHSVGGAGQISLRTSRDYTLRSPANFLLLKRTGALWEEVLRGGGEISMTGAAVDEAKTTIASAATPDIWTAAGNIIDYTGTTTATGFAAAPQAGARRTLVCAGAAVFTAGANMLIQGVASGANFTAAAGDEIEVLAITTTQFRLTIQKATGKSVTPSLRIAAAGGSADAITATFDPPATLTDKMRCDVVAGAANATTTPTFAPDGLTAHTITKNGGAALAVGDIPGALAVIQLEYNLANTRWELMNPATIAPGANTVGTGQLKTATGSASAAFSAHILNVTMNDYSFFPSCFQGTNFDGANITMLPTAGADPNNTIGQFTVTWTGGTGGTMIIRWRYMTATDNPTIWVGVDGSGNIVTAWVSDDPIPGGVCPLKHPTLTFHQLDPNDLGDVGITDEHKTQADAWIKANGYSAANRNYRAFQQMTGQAAPSTWLIEHAKHDSGTNKLVLRAI